MALRKVCLLFGLVMITSMTARGQGFGDKIELFGGYSYTHFKSTPAANLNGFDAAGKYKLWNWLGIVADVGGEYGKVNSVSSKVYTYLGGPEVSWTPHRFSPFAHLLVGGAHFSGGDFTSKGFAYAIGAGIDYKASKRFSWRIFQIDDLPTHLGSHDQHSARIATGIVIHF